MADNEGNYVEYEEIIAELYEDGSSTITSETTALTNKVTDTAGDTFEYTGSPQVNDVLYQAGEIAVITEFLTSPNRIRIDRTGSLSTIVNGPAQFLRSSQLTKRRAEGLIKEKMAIIDRGTRQFFNKRTGSYSIEGNNTPALLLPCAAIEVTTIEINSTSSILYPGEDRDFIAFVGREAPADDRWNPRIKLNVGRGRDNIYVGVVSNRIFARNTITVINGSFGFLEPDGSTPEPIKRAMKLLIYRDLNRPVTKTGATGSAGAGPLRRYKVDLHEKEFFASASEKLNEQKSSITGIHEVDVIMTQYRSPLFISGSIPRFRGQRRNRVSHVL